MYPPLFLKGNNHALQLPDQDAEGDTGAVKGPWEDLDSRFRRDLPDDLYVRRLAYRGLTMRTRPDLRVLDGIAISNKERKKTQAILDGLLVKESS